MLILNIQNNNVIIQSNINSIYIIQWFIIQVTYIMIVYFFKGVVFGDVSLMIITAAMTAVSIMLAEAVSTLNRKKKA